MLIKLFLLIIERLDVLPGDKLGNVSRVAILGACIILASNR